MREITAETLSAYLDGQLEASERAAVEEGLEKSPALRERLASLRETVASVKNLEREEVPDDLFRNIARHIELSPESGLSERLSHRRGRYLQSGPMTFTLLAIVLALAVIALLVSRAFSPPTRVLAPQAGPVFEDLPVFEEPGDRFVHPSGLEFVFTGESFVEHGLGAKLIPSYPEGGFDPQALIRETQEIGTLVDPSGSYDDAFLDLRRDGEVFVELDGKAVRLPRLETPP